MSENSQQPEVVVCALYKFVRLDDYVELRQPVLDQLNALGLRGTILLAREGINGTIAGSQSAIETFQQDLARDPRFAAIDYKLSRHVEAPFHRTKVKLKSEIVTMGVDGIDPNELSGTYVDPVDWNELIADPETLVIDTRNEYEVGIGSFTRAVNPHTESFREFPQYVEDNLDPTQHTKVAMFCTGGIRCEKASAFMRQKGFAEVFHLKGGILNYLDKVPAADSLWQGECFVFDDRVAVDQALQKGQYDQCHACRYPVTEQDKQSPHYVPGVSCPRCHDSLTDEQKARFGERERQMQLAKQRGESHLGSDSHEVAERNRAAKLARKTQQ